MSTFSLAGTGLQAYWFMHRYACGGLSPKAASCYPRNQDILVRNGSVPVTAAGPSADASSSLTSASLRLPSLALFSELIRFLGAGVIATAFQYTVLVILVEMTVVDPVMASTLGYIGSSSLNYVLRRNFVFRANTAHQSAIPKFIAVSLTGLALNSSLMALGVFVLEAPYLLVQIVTTAIVFMWNFTAHRNWTFARSKHGPDERTTGRRDAPCVQADTAACLHARRG